MEWLPGLLKHLEISRSVVGAAFVTSAVLYAGPRLAPAYVDPVPREWSYALVGTLVFSGSLLLFWTLSHLWTLARRRWARVAALLRSHDLNQSEIDFLHALGQNPTESLYLKRMDYEGLGMSRLEVLELVNGLREKGLVSANQFGSELVSLSSEGRKRALEIQRAANGNAT